MKRRQFITLLGSAACSAVALSPVSALSQQTKMHRVAFFVSTSPLSELVGPEPIHPFARAFLHGLRLLGYIEERRSLKPAFCNHSGFLPRPQQVCSAGSGRPAGLT